MPYTVYILKNGITGQFYIGHTENLARRLSQHNDPNCHISKYTKRNKGVWNCVYKEEFSTRSEAIRREKQIKAKKSRRYIEYLISNWKHLKGC